MTADEFNALYPVGTPVVAYTFVRPEHPVAVKFREAAAAGRRGDAELDPCERLDTRTRRVAWELGHGAPVVLVDGYSGGICLTHVDVVPSGDAVATLPEFLAALTGGDLPPVAVREERCLRSPFSCGLPLAPRVFDSYAAVHEAEWRISGLCPACQDRIAEGGEGGE